MENKRANLLFKRILFFTKVILTSLVICFILVLNFLDYKEIRENDEYLTFLGKVKEIDDKDLSAGQLEFKIAQWVVINNAPLGEQYLNERTKLAVLLKNNGLPDSVISASKGYRGDNNIFQALAIEVNPIPGELENDTDASSVNNAILEFRYLAAPTQIHILTGVDTSAFKAGQQQLDDQPVHTGNEPVATTSPTSGIIIDEPPVVRRVQPAGFFTRYDFKGLSFSKDSVSIHFVEKMTVGQQSPLIKQISLPATHQTIQAPSLLYFAGFDSAAIARMYKDSSRLDEIKALYGNQPLKKVGELLGKSVENNTGAVSVLGFDISRKWFPLSILVLLCLVNFIIYRNISIGIKEKVKVISENTSDDALELLVTGRTIRFLLWVLPAVLILSSVLLTSFIHYSMGYYAIMIACCVVAMVTGALSYRLSGKL